MFLIGMIMLAATGCVTPAPAWPIWPAHDPPAPFVRFRVQTRNIPSASISGVILPAAGRARGTLFLCHGYGRSKETLYGWNWIRRDLGWNLVLFDFREHGRSTHSPRLCTLGYHEIWDVKAVVDLAEERGLAKPYAIYGHSLGASVGMRWAGMDGRIKSVLAVSPFRNGLVAARQYLRQRPGWEATLANTLPGYSRMLDTVDMSAAVAQRNDLRIWILCGEHDTFPAADQRAILAASPAPAVVKRLFVVPGGNHNNLWSWRGSGEVPGHDEIVTKLLAETR
jgi:pimeloyl-ACP methyl ester carboxylesterase